MRKILSIIHYEYKMLMKRFATLGVLLIGTLVALLPAAQEEEQHALEILCYLRYADK